MNRRSSLIALFGIISALGLWWTFTRAVPRAHADERTEIDRLAQLMQWKAGANIADIGAGDGSFTFAAAEKLGPTSRVYATEIDQEKLKTLRAEVEKRKLQNVLIIESATDDTKLPTNCCDDIFLRRVYHHLTQPVEFDKNLLRSLKPGAHLAIIDFAPTDKYSPVPGVPKNRGGHGVPQKIMIEELTAAGLKVEKIIDNWQAQDYCVIFVKPS